MPQLDNLVAIGKLKAEPADRAEGLLRSGAARIVDAERSELSFESRFDLAYNAAGLLDQDVKLLEAVLRIAREVEKRVTQLLA